MALYIVENLWKERNRRIFYNNYSTTLQVAGQAKEDLEQYKMAFGASHPQRYCLVFLVFLPDLRSSCSGTFVPLRLGGPFGLSAILYIKFLSA